MSNLSIKTSEKREVIDITDKVSDILSDLGAGDGICNLALMHTTAALTVGELESGNGPDLLKAADEMVPKLTYEHSDDQAHVSSHIISAMIGPTVTLPVKGGKLVLGTWQRVALVELDGPRERKVNITFIKNG